MRTLLVFAVVLAVLWGYQALQAGRAAAGQWRRVYDAFLGLAVLIGGAFVGIKAWHTMHDVPAWDVKAFWIYGRATAIGLNPYLPSSMQAALPPGTVLPSDFTPELLDVGCVYPPPTLLLLAPFGLLPLSTAAVVWVALQILALIACVFLLWKIFFRVPDFRALGVAAALTLWLPATGVTIDFGQTGLLALFCILLTWRTRQRSSSAFAIAGATLVKPFLHILWLYPLIQRRWRTLITGAITMTVLCGLSMAIFGVNTFMTYIHDNPVKRTPFSALTEPANASLAAVILRHATALHISHPQVMNPVFVTVVLIILVITAIAAYFVAKQPDSEPLAMAILIPAGMLIYPGTLSHYSVMLLAPIVWVWTQGASDETISGWLAISIAFLFGVMHADAGHETILATGAVWAAFVAYAIRIRTRSRAMRSESRTRWILDPG